jgi:UDP-N-acetylglucosamine 2-epimerase (non-hydrolysing)
MKILTILGTRPEIIRLSKILPKLDKLCEHIIVHTGQNYSPELSEIFFKEFKLRPPNYYLEAEGTFAEQLAIICTKIEEIILKENPDKFLVLGDTNSSLAAIVAKRMGVPVYHMEAGNRSNDERMPEETNRRLIDHCSTILLPYTERSRQNLLSEGIPSNKIYVTGNPIYEVMKSYQMEFPFSSILNDLKIEKDKFFLVTMHRAENIDNSDSLTILLNSLNLIGEIYKIPVIISTHPHTQKMLNLLEFKNSEYLQFCKPFKFLEFLKLENSAKCVITDSGTVQEECAILHIPNVTIRSTTERPETLECGSNIVSGVKEENILDAVSVAITMDREWNTIPEYYKDNVSETIIKILFSTC